ncbi:MAG: right-handed parallel beta-helix repeat-containing protein [archaeon]|nr:right-handed parallel beta-helix repeat-containing protein [archaeon]
MKKLIGTIVIAMLLIMPLIVSIPVSVSAQPTMKLSDAVGGGTGGTFYLNPNILYTGGVTITGDTRIYGQGAMIDLQWESIKVTGTYLYIERCVLTNGTDGGTDYYGALEFYDDASGFVYNNIIVDSDYDGIHIEDCDKYEIIIKENSILYSSEAGIYFEDSTDITILENIIKNNNYGIYGDNEHLYDEDPNSLHNIIIKGNEIGVNSDSNIYLRYVNDVSIASNLIYGSNSGYGIQIYYCPIVSITHNKILANENEGIYYYGDSDWPIVLVDTTEVEVLLSLTISYNKIMGQDSDGMSIKYTQNVVITYNEIVGNNDEGIYLEGYNQDFLMEPVLIAYNTISYNDGEGIYIGDEGNSPYYGGYVSDVTILFNKIVGNVDDGIFASAYNDGEDNYGENLLIKGNVINGNEGEAMEIKYWYAPVIIEWNTVLNNNDAVELDYVESPQIIHNTIMYERACDYGIDLYECDGARIAYNTISYNTGDNIYVDESDDVVIEYNTIVGSHEDGIEVGDCDSMTIQYNIIHNNYEDGIEFDDSSGLISNNIIGHTDGNLISGQWIGIYVEDCYSGDDELVTISDNIIIGNYEGIYIDSSDPAIVRNYIANNVYGICMYSDSDPTIGGSYDNRNFIIRNYADGIYINDDASDPIINYNNIYGNVNYGINNWAATTTIDHDAEYNWWGAMDGPGGVGPGSGDEVTAYVDYIPWLTAIIP